MCFRIRVLLALLYALGFVAITVGAIAALGETVWQDDGVVLCDQLRSQSWVQVVSDRSGGAIVVWSDQREIGNEDIYAQRVDGRGNALWLTDGVSICVAGGY